MRIKARLGISADGYAATTDGTPSLVRAAGFVPGQSHGYPEFIDGCHAVVMGRQTFLGAPRWPWGDMQVVVLTSQPLPAGTPSGVLASPGGPAGLTGQLPSRASGGDVHLVGSPHIIQAIHLQGALDSLVVVPILLGGGIPLWPPGPRRPGCGCGAAPGSSRTALPSSATRRPDPCPRLSPSRRSQPPLPVPRYEGEPP